jgi:predicted Zn-dependent protease
MVSKGFTQYHFFGIIAIPLLLCSFILGGCATNPATKQLEFMTVSENHEIEIGQDVDKQVREEMGLYFELPELRSFVKTIGKLPHGALAGAFYGHDSNTGAIIMAEGIAFTKGTNGFSLIGRCRKEDFKDFQPLVESMAKSIKFISHKEAANIKPARLRVHKVKTGETWASIAKKHFASSKDMARLVEYNGFEPAKKLTVGTLFKIPPTLHMQ